MDVVFTPKPARTPSQFGSAARAGRRCAVPAYAHCWYPVGTNPQFPMNTVSRFKTGLARFMAYESRAQSEEIAIALRVLSGPGDQAAPLRSKGRRRCSPAEPRIG